MSPLADHSSGGAKSGALARSLQAMTFGAIRASDVRRADYERDRLGEIDQQFQLPISGTATTEPQFAEVTVDFAAPFIDAYDERQSPYSDPTFTFGLHVPTAEVFFSVLLRTWVLKDEFYRGATIAVAAWSPNASAKFSGFVHLNFQGYGTPYDDEADEGDAT